MYAHTVLCKIGIKMQKHGQTPLRVWLLDWRGQRATNCMKHGGQHQCGLLPKNRNITRSSVKKDNWTLTSLLMALTSDNELTPRLNLGHGEKSSTAGCWATSCVLKELRLMFTCMVTSSVSYPVTKTNTKKITDSGQVFFAWSLGEALKA